MRLELKQESKELLRAAFCFRQGDAACGALTVEGGFDPDWAKLRLQLFGRDFRMEHEGSILSFHGKSEATGEKTYRPYRIETEGTAAGGVYQVTESHGLFSKANYFKMSFRDVLYCAYPVACGREGFRICVYRGEEQTALILKSAAVTDDLHHYTILALTEDDAVIAALFSSYMYAVGPYKPGMEIRKGTFAEYRKTNDKFLLSKDDRSFEGRC